MDGHPPRAAGLAFMVSGLATKRGDSRTAALESLIEAKREEQKKLLALLASDLEGFLAVRRD